MSRMIFAVCLLTTISGCMHGWVREFSILEARVQTLLPGFRGACDECSDCIPHQPIGFGYKEWCDYHVTEHTAHLCAFRSLRQYKKECGHPINYHFRSGFIAAYEDLALNRQPSPPAYPPPLYWNAYYRSCAGEPCIDEWYAGYEAGLDIGQNSGVSKFNEAYITQCADSIPSGAGGYRPALQHDAAHEFAEPTPEAGGEPQLPMGEPSLAPAPAYPSSGYPPSNYPPSSNYPMNGRF